MELRILCKHLVADELNGKFTIGEDFADVVGIDLPRFYDRHDLSQFSFRIAAAGECKNAAVQLLEMDSFDERSIHLLWNVTSDFTAISEKFTLVLTGINSDNSVTIKFKSCPISVNPDETWEFLPSPELSEQILNQTQIEVQKAIEAAERAENASQKPAPAEIYPAAEETLGGVLSGNDISVSEDGTVTVNSVNGQTLGKSVPADAVFTDTVYTLPKAAEETLGGVLSGNDISVSEDGTVTVNSVNGQTLGKSVPADAVFTDTVYTLPKAAEETLGGVLSGNDISVSEDGTVTVNSVNGQTLGKSVPADAVFTDTVYTLPKAAEETLGGVLSGNDISVSEDGTVTVNSVNGQTLGKSVPADAVFTDTVYTLPKATAEVLGGVKVDGTTITASSDGTISARGVQNLAMQIAHPNNYLIYDNMGKPSVMVAIPKFYLDEVIDGASHTVHPAFIINGVEQDVIYISKYQNIVENGRAYSLPMSSATVCVTFDQANNYCKAKGSGWHLMTNAEWAAIALWCKKNGTIPKGNNNYGKDISETDLPQKAIYASRDGVKIGRVLTGSGPESWYHDGTYAGIADLNGNVWEWNSGLRLFNGEIQIIADNNAAVNSTDVSETSTEWKAIMPDGSLTAPGTTGTLKYNGNLISTSTGSNTNTLFKSIIAADGLTLPYIIKALALAPYGTDYENDKIWANPVGENISARGGRWAYGNQSGIFALSLNDPRSTVFDGYSFRSCYYNPT